MRRFGFLLSRRWAFFLVAVVLLTWLAGWLGQWQFGRLEERQERNASVLRNEKMAPVPVEDVLAVGTPVTEDLEWRHVTVRGTYLTDLTVHVRYRTNSQSQPGAEVVTPVELADGTLVLVDRGWWPTPNRGSVPNDTPAPPAGEVELTGWVRVDATGDSTAVTDLSTRAISSVTIAEAVERPVLGGFVQLETETPESEQPLTLPAKPELNEGPHFFYGIQWWFFGFMAIAGVIYLGYDEWRDRRDAEQSDVDGAAPADPGTAPDADAASDPSPTSDRQ